MKSFLKLIILVSLISQTGAAESNPFQRVLKEGGIPKDQLGIYIGKDQKIVFENQATKKFLPASLSKLLVAIATLKKFAPEERFLTEIVSSAKISNQKLDGEICLKGYGDPSFISEQMWVLINNFTRNQIVQIKGPIVIDSTYFDSQYFDGSRENVRVDRAYDSPVSGLPFNWNAVNVYVRPRGEVAQITVDPENTYFEVVNKVKIKSGKKSDIKIEKEKSKDGEKLIVSGTIGRNSDEIVKYASVTYPDLWVGKNLISFLKQRGIEIENNKIESKACPEKATVLAQSKGWTVFEILNGMLKFSNNFLAESLTKDLAAQEGFKPGSIEKGMQIIQSILEKEYDLSKDEYVYLNPSGFTEKNRISPEALGHLLWKAYKDFTISSYLLSALATPQVEGTLSKRMASLKQPRLIRAKTGLLVGAVGLAGYASDSKGEVYSFVFIYNGNGKEEKARELFDKLAIQITKL